MNDREAYRLFRHPDIYLAPCDFGIGVFAADVIASDTVLEECPFISVAKEDCDNPVNDYIFGLEEDDGEAGNGYALVLGYGSLFNHGAPHNTEYWYDTDKNVFVFHTVRDVGRGEQLFIDYGTEWWDSRDLTPLDETGSAS